jgi:hypothetical protein
MVPQLAAPSPFHRARSAGYGSPCGWFVAGIGLAVATGLTAMELAAPRAAHRPAWWLGGLAFIGIELVAHLALQFRGLPSFYNRRG